MRHGTHASCVDPTRIELSLSRVRYSVFRNHVTFGTIVGVDVPDADVEKPFVVNVPGAVSSRN